MQSFTAALNDMLISVYHNILRVEEEFLQKRHRVNLTMKETHMIEYIGSDEEEGRTLSEIADFLRVARPSITVAVRKLEEKGYLARKTCAGDGRVVRVTLTREGQKVFRSHMHFHMSMIHEIEQEFGEDEKEILIRVIGRLDKFFEKALVR